MTTTTTGLGPIPTLASIGYTQLAMLEHQIQKQVCSALEESDQDSYERATAALLLIREELAYRAIPF